MEKAEIKERITNVSAQLQQISRSQATIAKLIETGRVRVVEVPDKPEEDPAALAVTGPEAITAMLSPIAREMRAQKERLLNAKEALLNALEQEALGTGEPPEEDKAPEDKPEKPKKKAEKKTEKEEKAE